MKTIAEVFEKLKKELCQCDKHAKKWRGTCKGCIEVDQAQKKIEEIIKKRVIECYIHKEVKEAMMKSLLGEEVK